MPAGLAKGYDGTLIDSFPGLNRTWFLLAVLEALAFLAIVASLLMGEFLPQRRKPILLSGLTFSMLVFAVMTFGQNIVSNYEGVASLFTYMGVTAIVLGLVRFVPIFAETRPPADGFDEYGLRLRRVRAASSTCNTGLRKTTDAES